MLRADFSLLGGGNRLNVDVYKRRACAQSPRCRSSSPRGSSVRTIGTVADAQLVLSLATRLDPRCHMLLRKGSAHRGALAPTEPLYAGEAVYVMLAVSGGKGGFGKQLAKRGRAYRMQAVRREVATNAATARNLHGQRVAPGEAAGPATRAGAASGALLHGAGHARSASAATTAATRRFALGDSLAGRSRVVKSARSDADEDRGEATSDSEAAETARRFQAARTAANEAGPIIAMGIKSGIQRILSSQTE